MSSPSPLRWLFVLPWEPHHAGGVNQVVKSLAREMGARGGIAPVLGVNRWGQTRPERGEHEGIAVLRLWSPAPWTARRPLVGALAYLLRLPYTLLRLARLLRAEKVAVVNVHYVNSAALNWVLLRRLGLFRGRLVLSLHGRDLRNSLIEGRMTRVLWHLLLRGADAVVACSDGLREEATTAYGLAPARVRTIHNGMDASALEQARAAASKSGSHPPTARRFIVNVGTYEHKKGHDLLIRAFASLADRYPDVDLVIVGRDGETFSECNALIGTNGLGERVFLLRNLGHGQTLDILSRAEFFVLPSRNEGFALVLLEACAFGKPVIATDVCGVAELIDSDAAGRIVAPEDSAALAAAIRGFLDDPEAAAAMGQHGRDLVRTRFTWRERAAEYLELLDRRLLAA